VFNIDLRREKGEVVTTEEAVDLLWFNDSKTEILIVVELILWREREGVQAR
jgi:hypothetical protein